MIPEKKLRNSLVKMLFLLVLVVMPFVGCLTAQVEIQPEWVSRYKGPAAVTDIGFDIVTDNDGNVYVTGERDWIPLGNSDYVTIKYDSEGNELWTAFYDGPGHGKDDAQAIAVDDSGNVYVTGGSTGDTTSIDYATIKYDSNGNELWVVRFDDAKNADRAVDIAVDPWGNVIVTGTSHTGVNPDFLTIKYDNDGNKLWEARFNGIWNLEDGANALAVDNSGYIYVTGYTEYIWGTFETNYCTIKYEPSLGLPVWVSEYDGLAHGGDYARDIGLDSSGHVLVTGYSYGVGTDRDYATIQYDARNGNELWVSRYNSPGGGYDDQAVALVVDGKDKVIVTGISAIDGGGPFYDWATIKYDELGNELWVKRYDGSGGWQDLAYDIGVDKDNSVFVTGVSFDGDDDDYTTIKYSWDGNEQWIGFYDGPSNDFDEAWALAVDSNGNVVVTGQSETMVGDRDCVTLKYDQEGLALSVFPDTTVFHRGDMICFRAVISNYGETSTSFDAWTEVKIPSGSTLSPRLGPYTLSLAPGKTISPYACDGPIPMGAPLSNQYSYFVKLGTFPNRVEEERSFDFEIVGP